LENVLNSWRQRSLSYWGKALVINALALSCIWYVASLIHIAPWVLKEVNTLIYKFFCLVSFIVGFLYGFLVFSLFWGLPSPSLFLSWFLVFWLSASILLLLTCCLALM